MTIIVAPILSLVERYYYCGLIWPHWPPWIVSYSVNKILGMYLHDHIYHMNLIQLAEFHDLSIKCLCKINEYTNRIVSLIYKPMYVVKKNSIQAYVVE